jgi:catechol 2,3-dioxygenase-like lactoylglutathione lyase family enzyme
MHILGILMNVSDIDRSLEFYREVFGITMLARQDQLAVFHTGDSVHPQVIILRTHGTSSHRVGLGGGHVGMRALAFEVQSRDELERIATALDRRSSLTTKRSGESWTAAFGRDPDRIAVIVACSLTSQPLTLEAWANLDEILYSVGE